MGGWRNLLKNKSDLKKALQKKLKKKPKQDTEIEGWTQFYPKGPEEEAIIQEEAEEVDLEEEYKDVPKPDYDDVDFKVRGPGGGFYAEQDPDLVKNTLLPSKETMLKIDAEIKRRRMKRRKGL